MKPKKMSLANIQGKLSRKEMKEIMAGSGGGSGCCCYYNPQNGVWQLSFLSQNCPPIQGLAVAVKPVAACTYGCSYSGT